MMSCDDCNENDDDFDEYDDDFDEIDDDCNEKDDDFKNGAPLSTSFKLVIASTAA